MTTTADLTKLFQNVQHPNAPLLQAIKAQAQADPPERDEAADLFHILQASARAEGAGVPAKGLTGLGYEGHYFWDTEMYVAPFLTYTAPRVARNLLKFRFSMLEAARERAREVNQRGALFPWRTINGEEASAYYAAGTAQYHINADIVHAIRKYVAISGDEAFLHEHGAEIAERFPAAADDLSMVRAGQESVSRSVQTLAASISERHISVAVATPPRCSYSSRGCSPVA
mgnify:CR=1 FL=1